MKFLKTADFKHFVKSTLEGCILFLKKLYSIILALIGQVSIWKKNSPSDMKKIETTVKKL